MRILAYGGTGYYERLRLGEWGEIARGALEDTLGMPGEQMIYGVGLIDRRPFVVLRQRQTIEGGRSYAFSLLIDPGEKVWERFRWNAAEFIHVLLETPEKEQIFTAPENFGTQKWEELFDRLQPVETLPPLEKTAFSDCLDNFTAFWLGAAFADETVSFPLSDYDIENRPPPLEMAAFQAALPVCFRNGSGWLVGAGETNARSFGARLTLADGAAEAPEQTLGLISPGRHLGYAWETLLDRRELTVFEELAEKPLWAWTTDETSLISRRLIFLSDVLTASGSEATEFIHRLKDEANTAAFLQTEIRQALNDLLLRDSGKLNRVETEYLLRQKAAISEGLSDRLDETALIEFFKNENLAPDDPAAPPCPPGVRGEIWMRRLRAAKDSELPREFQRALGDLKNVGAPEDRRAGIEAEIENRIKQPGYELLYWRGAGFASSMLERAALAKAGKSGWEKAYLAFADDAGGGKLFAGYRFVDIEFSGFIKRLIDLAEAPEFKEKSLGWLNAVANSPARKYISIQQKKQISRLIRENLPAAENQWRNFDLLDALFRSEHDFNKIEAAPPEEQAFLTNELRQLSEGSFGSGRRLPNLELLCDLLGGRAAELDGIFDRPVINRVRCEGIENWINGWRRINPKKAALQTISFLIGTERKAAPDLVFLWLDDQSAVALFRTLLFEHSARCDELYRLRVAELLEQAENSNRIKTIIRDVFFTYFYKHKQVFARRFGFDEKSLNLLFSLLPKRKTATSVSRQDVFLGLAAWSEDKFADEACRVFEAVTAGGELLGEAVNDYRQLVLWAIKKDEGGIQSQIKRRLWHSRSAMKNFDRILAEAARLQPLEVEVESAVESNEIAGPEKIEKNSSRISGWLRRVWSHIRFVFGGGDEEENAEAIKGKSDDEKSGTV